jgi:hypothetical protein
MSIAEEIEAEAQTELFVEEDYEQIIHDREGN